MGNEEYKIVAIFGVIVIVIIYKSWLEEISTEEYYHLKEIEKKLKSERGMEYINYSVGHHESHAVEVYRKDFKRFEMIFKWLKSKSKIRKIELYPFRRLLSRINRENKKERKEFAKSEFQSKEKE